MAPSRRRSRPAWSRWSRQSWRPRCGMPTLWPPAAPTSSAPTRPGASTSAPSPEQRTVLLPRSYPWIILSHDYHPLLETAPAGELVGVAASGASTDEAGRPAVAALYGSRPDGRRAGGVSAARPQERWNRLPSGSLAAVPLGRRPLPGICRRLFGLPRRLPFGLSQRLRPRRLSQRLRPFQLPFRVSQRLSLPQRLPQRLSQRLR